MNREQILAEITALKDLLCQSDHVPNKLSEGIVLALDGATAVNALPRLLATVMNSLDEYRDLIKSRATWRARINDLEAKLKNLTDGEIS